MRATTLTAADIRGLGRQRGFTLIEALIAFVILSVGLLGIVSLQTLAKTSQHLAIQHTRAVTIADAIVERIRANPAGVAAYNQGLGNPPGGGTINVVPDCINAVCDPNDVAVRDLWGFEQALDGAGATIAGVNAAGLIQPRACIIFTPAPGRTRSGELSVIIQWRGLDESFDAVQGAEAVCGGAAAGTDNYRRQVITNTYVVDGTEF